MSFVVFVLACGYLMAADAQWAMPLQPQRNRQFQQFQQFQIPQQQQMGCYDTAINCLENSYFCTQPYYESTMRNQCARTCGFCREENNLDFSGNNCRDVNPECRMWASRGFCESLFYPEQVKRRYCAQSCNYCRSQQPEEEQIPEQPFADDPTSKEHTRKHHRKTTTPSTKESDEETDVTTTLEPLLDEEKGKNKSKKAKPSKKEDDEEN